jgi:hypothetical protein
VRFVLDMNKTRRFVASAFKWLLIMLGLAACLFAAYLANFLWIVIQPEIKINNARNWLDDIYADFPTLIEDVNLYSQFPPIVWNSRSGGTTLCVSGWATQIYVTDRSFDDILADYALALARRPMWKTHPLTDENVWGDETGSVTISPIPIVSDPYETQYLARLEFMVCCHACYL